MEEKHQDEDYDENQDEHQQGKENSKKYEPIAGYQSELHIEKEYVCGCCNLVMKSKDHHVKCPKCGKYYEREEE